MVLAVISLIQHCLPNLLLLSLQHFTSKLTSPLAGALHFQTYFSSRCSTSLPNLLAAPLAAALHFQTYFLAPLASALHFQTYLLLSLQHFTSKLTFTLARCSTSLLPNLLQISVRSSSLFFSLLLALRRCTLLHSTFISPLTSTISHTHTHT